MWEDIKAVYRTGWRAAFVLPLLFLIPAVVEFLQHVVELRTGMYDSVAAAKAASDDPMRMASGFAKTVALLLPGYWFVRLMAFGDKSKAARPERPAFTLWLVLFALQATVLAYSLFGTSVAAMFDLTGREGTIFDSVLSAIWFIVSIYLTAWYVAWPLGNQKIGPIRSLKIMAGSFWRTIGYMVGCVLPLMALHYALSYLAIAATPGWLDWPVLLIDSLVVALLACTMAGSAYIATRSAAARKGVELAG